MPAVYFFLIDVSMNAIQTGATAAACNAIQQVLSDLPVSFVTISNIPKQSIIFILFGIFVWFTCVSPILVVLLEIK